MGIRVRDREGREEGDELAAAEFLIFVSGKEGRREG
jgi:hypothetical protein